MNVGRELDAYLAKQYFGFRYLRYTDNDDIIGYADWQRYDYRPLVPVPNFCSSDEAADRLIETLRKGFKVTTERAGSGWVCTMTSALGTYSTFSTYRAEAIAVTIAVHSRELEARDVWHRKEFPFVYRGKPNPGDEPFIPSLKTDLRTSPDSSGAADSEGQE